MAASNADWVEGEVTWNNKKTSPNTPWSGGDATSSATFVGSSSGPFGSGSAIAFTISEAILDQTLLDGELALLLRSDSAEADSGENFAVVAFRESASSGDRPTLSFLAIPEPSTAPLAGMGLLALSGYAARRRIRRDTRRT